MNPEVSFVPLMPPIFVVGYMHSGTGLLRHILRNHPHVYNGRGETRFFANLPLIRAQFPDLTDEPTRRAYLIYLAKIIHCSYGKVHFELRGNQSLVDFDLSEALIAEIMANSDHLTHHVQAYRHVYGRLALAFGKQRWLEKTPTHLFYMAQILRNIPDARFIEVVRDPRDILSSKFRRAHGKAPTQANPLRQHIAGLQAGFDPVWDTLGWKSAVRTANRAHEQMPERILRVRYEDLVTTPAQTVAQICEFLEISFDESMLVVPWQNTADQSQRQVQGIGRGAVGKWRNILPPEASRLCEWIARGEMKQLAYVEEGATAVSFFKLIPLLTKSGIEFSQRLYRRWRLGGLRYARNVLSGYWLRLINVLRV